MRSVTNVTILLSAFGFLFFFSQKRFEFWHSRLRGSLRLCLATVEGRGRKRNENTFLMFGNREKRNSEEMERRMYAFTFMPTHEFERGKSDGQKCNFGYMKGQMSGPHYFLSKMRGDVWNRSLTKVNSIVIGVSYYQNWQIAK